LTVIIKIAYQAGGKLDG